jgi:hypothetical protein
MLACDSLRPFFNASLPGSDATCKYISNLATMGLLQSEPEVTRNFTSEINPKKQSRKESLQEPRAAHSAPVQHVLPGLSTDPSHDG